MEALVGLFFDFVVFDAPQEGLIEEVFGEVFYLREVLVDGLTVVGGDRLLERQQLVRKTVGVV